MHNKCAWKSPELANNAPMTEHTSHSKRQTLPAELKRAIVGMWLSLVIGIGFSVFQAVTVDSPTSTVELLLTISLIAFTMWVYRQVAEGKNWARLAYLALLVLSYALTALDPMGMSKVDLIAFVITAPIDIFVVVMLFGAKASAWFLSTE